jgi:pimeloyl-ACP methyl ester carboxylesterase
MMHGGGFQGTEWFDTPDGRPGWAQRLVEAGYAVLVIDRPGHGRSPYHTDTLGPMGPPFSYESGRQIYFPGDDGRHTQWPFASGDEAAMDEFIAGYGTADFLNGFGASVELLALADHGVRGNGHGLIYEKNSDAALAPVLDWVTRRTEVEDTTRNTDTTNLL